MYFLHIDLLTLWSWNDSSIDRREQPSYSILLNKMYMTQIFHATITSIRIIFRILLLWLISPILMQKVSAHFTIHTNIRYIWFFRLSWTERINIWYKTVRWIIKSQHTLRSYCDLLTWWRWRVCRWRGRWTPLWPGPAPATSASLAATLDQLFNNNQPTIGQDKRDNGDQSRSWSRKAPHIFGP